MRGKVYDCPKCGGFGYMAGTGTRCSMCGGKGKVEDGGPSVVAGDGGVVTTSFIGKSGFCVVLNLRTHDDN